MFFIFQVFHFFYGWGVSLSHPMKVRSGPRWDPMTSPPWTRRSRVGTVGARCLFWPTLGSLSSYRPLDSCRIYICVCNKHKYVPRLYFFHIWTSHTVGWCWGLVGGTHWTRLERWGLADAGPPNGRTDEKPGFPWPGALLDTFVYR